MKRFDLADRLSWLICVGLPLLLLVAVLFSACTNNPPDEDATADVQWEKIGTFTYVARVDVEGVDCVVVAGTDGRGGIDCDWSVG